MNARQEPLRAESNQMELVDFRIFERKPDGGIYEGIYGINVSKVREIIILPTLSRVPDAHPAIEGIFNLRGVQVPAVNLATWLNVEEAAPEGVKPKVIVTEFSSLTIGLIIHQASRIRRISWDDIKPPPSLVSQQHGASIVGTTLIDDDQTLLMIDIEKIAAEMQGKSAEEIVDERLSTQHIGQHQGRILMVDDSSIARRQLSHTLQRAGYEVIEAADGQQAFDMLKEMQVRAAAAGRRITDELDLLVSDVEMPRMDGYSLTAHLKADEAFSALPIIMHSSLGGEANQRKGKEAGADESLIKFDPQILLEAIERHLEKAV